jgi:DNA polymerase-3 subunit delta
MPKPVYALVGSDAFLQLEALANLLRETGADVQRVDADGETAQLADVLDELRSFAMFGGGKLVVVRNADAFLTKFRESLEDYVAAPSNSAIQV